MGHCRFGDKCAYLHLPPTPHNLSATPLPAGYHTSPTPALSPLHSFASDKAILAHLPPSPTSTDGTSSSSGHNSVEDLTAMMQRYTFGPVLSVPGSGLVDRISLPPVPPCTPAIFDPLSTPQSTTEVRLVPVPVPVPIVPAVLRRGSEGTIRPDLNSKGESYLRNRSRSLAYGVNLFKSKHQLFSFCLCITIINPRIKLSHVASMLRRGAVSKATDVICTYHSSF